MDQSRLDVPLGDINPKIAIQIAKRSHTYEDASEKPGWPPPTQDILKYDIQKIIVI
jgi:hypothetical protein